MRVAVTGANGQVGRRLLERLKQREAETVALVRQAQPLPADRVVTDWMRSPQAVAALQQADWVIQLAGALAPPDGNYAAANLEPCRRVAQAVGDQNETGVVFLSYVGADEASANAYLAAKAAGERILQGAVTDSIIFRCTHIFGPPDRPGPTAARLRSESGHPVTVLGTGRQRWSPVFLDDVVEAILAAIDRREIGRYDLAGFETQALDEWVRLLNGDLNQRIRHLPRWLALAVAPFTSRLNATLVDLLCRDSISDPLEALTRFDLPMTRLSAVWSGAGD